MEGYKYRYSGLESSPLFVQFLYQRSKLLLQKVIFL